MSLNVSSSPAVRTSTLHTCAASGDATQLRKLLLEEKIAVYTTTPDGTSALHCAAEAGSQGLSSNIVHIRNTLTCIKFFTLLKFGVHFTTYMTTQPFRLCKIIQWLYRNVLGNIWKCTSYMLAVLLEHRPKVHWP